MKTIIVAMTTATALFAAMPLPADTAKAADTPKADAVQLAQLDVRIGERRGPGVVIGTEGRRYRERDRFDRSDCRKITVTEWRRGVRVERTKWRCDD
jgi:hypothetical protein